MRITIKLLIVAAVLFSIKSADAQYISYSVARHTWRENPEVNNYLSARYDRLLQTNLRFRHYRMWKECHTINFSRELQLSCLGSFDQYEPIIYYR